MKLFKRRKSKFWQYKFMLNGELYRGSTDLTNKEKAETLARKIRDEIVNGNVGILEKKPVPTLKEFLDDSFLPFVEAKHNGKKNTLDYYKYGARQLLGFREIAGVQIDQITEEHSSKFITAYHNDLSASGINQALRTLRRALRLAFIWKKIDRQPAIPLMSGERKRTRIVTEEEEKIYLKGASQPWRTMATTMIGLGPRPSEILLIRCENISWESFTLSIVSGKSAAAKRDLPLTDEVYDALHSWWVAIGSPKVGYLFPAIGPGSMHLGRAGKRGGCAKRTEEDVYKASRAAAGYKSRPYSDQRIHDWHHEALEAAGMAEAEREAGESLVPYHLRHSALTRLAENCPNPYAIAAAAGHSSISMTYRYVHPQKREIWAAFERKSGHVIGHRSRVQNFKVVGSDEIKNG